MNAPVSTHFLLRYFELCTWHVIEYFCRFLDKCGDGGQASQATITNPKGLTFDSEGTLFFVDGTRIRTIRPTDNVVETYAGSLTVHGARPVPCQGSISLDQVIDRFISYAQFWTMRFLLIRLFGSHYLSLMVWRKSTRRKCFFCGSKIR